MVELRRDDAEDEDDEEDVKELRRKAMEIASRLVIYGYKPDAVAKLDFVTPRIVHHDPSTPSKLHLYWTDYI